MNDNPTVAVLTEWASSYYGRTLCRHLEAEAARNGATLRILATHWATATSPDVKDEIDQTLQWASAFDGMVLLSGVFAHGIHGLLRFAQGWAPRPVASIGYRLPGVPTVLINNRAAMRQATSHLIAVHRRRKLLFLRGRRDSQESEERFFGYRHALREHGLLHEERRILAGDFTRAGASQALSSMDPTLDFDGIVAANDDMALAAVSDAVRRGKRVPEDVAIIGFDDVAEAQQSVPPLSSVAQPFGSFAKEAIRLVLSQIQGRSVAEVTEVPVTLVTRRSCGCR